MRKLFAILGAALALIVQPALAATQMPPAPAQMQTITRYSGWSVIGNRPNFNRSLTTTGVGRTTAQELVVPYDYQALVACYSNIYVNTAGETPTPNSIFVSAGFRALNAPLSTLGAGLVEPGNDTVPIKINGQAEATIAPRGIVCTDPISVAGIANRRNFIKTYMQATTRPAPSAPTATATTGSGIANGTYAVGIAIDYGHDDLTPGSAAASVVTTTGNNQITITSPSAATYPGALGYIAYISTAGTTTPLYFAGLPRQPFGTDAVLTALPSSSLADAELRVLNGQPGQSPVGATANGGSAAGAVDNGEYVTTSLNTIPAGWVTSANLSASGYGPVMVLGLDPLRVHDSYCAIGDSLMQGAGDVAYQTGSQGGGVYERAAMNQFGRYYDPTIAPLIGHANFGVSGDKASSFNGPNGLIRREFASHCTKVIDDYGSNDLAGSGNVGTLISNIYAIGSYFTKSGPDYYHFTLTTRTNSSDGWTTLANQSLPASGVHVNYIGAVLQTNNWLLTGATHAVAAEAMFGGYSTATPSTNLWGGGNGSTTTFMTSLPFVQGTETIKVNNVTKALTTDYTYLNATTLNGVSFAQGVVFGSAPGNGLSVTAAYTAIDGFQTMMGSKAHPVDLRGIVTVNGAGAADVNGVWWKPADVASLDTISSTGSNTSLTFNYTSKGYSQDQYRGSAIYITSDSTTPAAVGQLQIVGRMTSTVITVAGWTTTPSSVAVAKLYDPYTPDGVHVMYLGCIPIARAIQAQTGMLTAN